MGTSRAAVLLALAGSLVGTSVGQAQAFSYASVPALASVPYLDSQGGAAAAARIPAADPFAVFLSPPAALSGVVLGQATSGSGNPLEILFTTLLGSPAMKAAAADPSARASVELFLEALFGEWAVATESAKGAKPGGSLAAKGGPPRSGPAVEGKRQTPSTRRVADPSTGKQNPSTVVPEPASMALLATGLLGLAASRGRRRTPAERVG